MCSKEDMGVDADATTLAETSNVTMTGSFLHWWVLLLIFIILAIFAISVTPYGH